MPLIYMIERVKRSKLFLFEFRDDLSLKLIKTSRELLSFGQRVIVCIDPFTNGWLRCEKLLI
ncbi:hypothetical protein B0E51_06780 [Rhodanobacter sp. C05]|nr:hypothetical protein B0E51_06780 [Rhodanobacter sp. C05]